MALAPRPDIDADTLIRNGDQALYAAKEERGRYTIFNPGTGYSSFTQLRDLPVSEIKIDKSFVTRVTGSSANSAIVKSAIDLGHTLGLYVVSEGVETYETLDALTDMGCDVMQGYLFAHPMPERGIRLWSLEGAQC
ncbi:MAG TPA: GGDEF domain-containing phosphodiesterase [Actinoplanes sp.]|nr:GGDEF domain-containing phosphodiesterase [Actinoplanes sp.]